MSRSQEEFRLACFVADTLRQAAEPGIIWTHFPAGENRDPITGSRLKRMGTQRGWADYIFIGHSFVGFLELKSEKGRPSPEQQAFKSSVEAMGCLYDIARNGDEAIGILRAWGVLKRIQPSVTRPSALVGEIIHGGQDA